MAKGPEAFRTISEAAEELGVPQHVLRFWETRFSFIRPMKRAGGRRFYRPQDVDVLRAVQTLLHERGYTIKGVQRLHREHGLKRMVASAESRDALGDLDVTPIDLGGPPDTAELSDADRERLSEALSDLLEAKARLDRLLKGG